MQEPREFLGALFKSVRTSIVNRSARTPIVLDIYGDAVDMISARDAEWQARVEKLEAVLTGLLLAKDVLFRCVCEADDEEHLQSLVDSTDNLWNDARAALRREA